MLRVLGHDIVAAARDAAADRGDLDRGRAHVDRRISAEDVRRVTDEEVAKLGDGYEDARAIFERIATEPEYVEFLTLPAYDRLVATTG